MNTSSRSPTLAPFLLVAAVACAGPEPFREGVRVSDQLYPGAVAGDRGPFLTRLVDDFTGAPVAGAEVFLVKESDTPIAGEFWFSHHGVSDAEGFVRIPRPNGDRDWHLQVLRHPQYGTVARGGSWNGIWRLGAAFDVPVRITDWLGRPAPGARIGFCGYCGHSPDLVNATADANGIAVLRGIDPQQDIADLYVQHPGLHFFYQSVEWRPGDGPMEVRCRVGPVQTGTVVDHRGQPVAGAFVRGGGRHRGPWARTAADGTFTVLGAEPSDTPDQVRTPQGRDIYFPSASRFPVTLQLPDLADPDAYQGTIDVPRQRGKRERVAVPTRVVRVVVQQAPSAALRCWAQFEGMPERLQEQAGEVEVPASGAFVLHVTDDSPGGSRARQFPFAAEGPPPDPIVVRWTPDVPVVGRAVDAAGQPRAARVRWRDHWSDREGDVADAWGECPDGTFRLTPRVPGTWLLEVADAAGALRSRLLWVAVPKPGAAAQVDVGDVCLGAPAALRFVGDDGAPVRAGLATVARPGWQQAGEPLQWPLADDGTWRGPDLRAGDAVSVQRDANSVPFRAVLQGDGPWTIPVPSGQLDLTIVDGDGQGLAAVVLFADQWVDAEDGAVSLRGLSHGPTRLCVSAPGRRSAVVDARVGPSPQTVRVVLPPR